jgi:uncharacterized protein YggE
MSTTISVSGHAEHRVPPELAAVSLSAGASGPDRDDVADRTGAAHARLLAEVHELEASGALETWSSDQLRAWSHRPWSADGKLLPLVHQANVEVEVVFRDLERLGEWVGDAAGSADLTVGGIQWRLTEPTRLRVQESAQRDAVADALAKARVYASALGLGDPAPIELADHGLLAGSAAGMPKAMMMRSVADPSGGAPTEFAPQDLVVEASVEARFAAEPT